MEKSLGTMMPADLVDVFVQQVKQYKVGNIKACLIAAARLWASLPKEVQRNLITLDNADMFSALKLGIEGYDIQREFFSLPPEQQKALLEGVAKARAIVSRKEKAK